MCSLRIWYPYKIYSIIVILVFYIIYFLLPSTAKAETPLRWYGYVYSGKSVSDSFLDIHTNLYSVDYMDSKLVAIGGGRELYHYGNYITFEGEGQIAHYIDGINDHSEFNGAINIRWQPFPWDKWLDTSFAWGSGLSFATEKPKVERQTADRPRHLLFYMMAEIEIMIPKQEKWSVFTRTHHRSSAGEILNGSDAASNSLVFGIKKRF